MRRMFLYNFTKSNSINKTTKRHSFHHSALTIHHFHHSGSRLPSAPDPDSQLAIILIPLMVLNSKYFTFNAVFKRKMDTFVFTQAYRMIFKYTVYILYIYFFIFIDAHLPRVLLYFILVFALNPDPPRWNQILNLNWEPDSKLEYIICLIHSPFIYHFSFCSTIHCSHKRVFTGDWSCVKASMCACV